MSLANHLTPRSQIGRKSVANRCARNKVFLYKELRERSLQILSLKEKTLQVSLAHPIFPPSGFAW